MGVWKSIFFLRTVIFRLFFSVFQWFGDSSAVQNPLFQKNRNTKNIPFLKKIGATTASSWLSKNRQKRDFQCFDRRFWRQNPCFESLKNMIWGSPVTLVSSFQKMKTLVWDDFACWELRKMSILLLFQTWFFGICTVGVRLKMLKFVKFLAYLAVQQGKHRDIKWTKNVFSCG